MHIINKHLDLNFSLIGVSQLAHFFVRSSGARQRTSLVRLTPLLVSSLNCIQLRNSYLISFLGGIVVTLLSLMLVSTMLFLYKTEASGKKYKSISIAQSVFDKKLIDTVSLISNISTNVSEVERDIPQNDNNSSIITHGARDKKDIALTFDAEMTRLMRENLSDGMVKSSFDRRIIDTLIQAQTPATFFLTGMWVQLYPQEARLIADNPLFEIGSHSYADTSFAGNCFGLEKISPTAQLEDVEFTQKILRQATGVDNRYFRFPGGCFDSQSINLIKNTAGLEIVHWDVAGEDGFNQNADSIAHNVVSSVQNGSIIVLHLNGEPTAPKTAAALPAIITQLKQEGYNFVKISDLLGE